MRVREDFRSLSGPEKAAILMLSLGEEHASHLFGNLAENEIQEISKTMAGLGTISADVVERLFVEFSDEISDAGTLVGTPESTERLLKKVMGDERSSAIMEDLNGPVGRTMWDKLGNVNEQVLANYLKNEYPQTVAVVLTKIKSDHAARVIACLPENFSMEVVNRMLSMDAVQKEVVDEVEETLRTEFMPNISRTQRRDSHEMVAEIINGLDRGTENRLMSMLEERNRDAAEKIRQIMFTFEDLVDLEPAAIQTLLRDVDKKQLATALKGASESLKDVFFENLSERAAKLLEEDMAGLGPVRLREVDEAQAAIIGIVKDLTSRGEIVMAHGDSDDELIY